MYVRVCVTVCMCVRSSNTSYSELIMMLMIMHISYSNDPQTLCLYDRGQTNTIHNTFIKKTLLTFQRKM